MKILICVGSYRKNGNTDQITRLIAERLQNIAGLQPSALEVETLYLGQQDLKLCRGCRVCFDRGEAKCPHRDDLLAIKAKMQQADGLVIASPVYVDDVSAIVKNWIDRLAHVCHRPEFAGKCAYLIATTGSSPTNRTLGTLQSALSTWGFHIVGKAGFKAGALMKPEESRARYQRKTDQIAQELFTAIHERRYLNPSFRALMTFKIQQKAWQKANLERYDTQFWQNQGWLDPARDFYIAHHAPWVKVALARRVGAVVSRFVS